MRKLLVLALSLCFVFGAQANCLDIFKRDMEERAAKLKRSRLAGRITYPVTTVAAGSIAAISPIAAYGTIGIFIGASAGLVITAPIAATFLTINGVRAIKLKGINQTYMALEHAYGNISPGTGKAFSKILKRVKKTKLAFNSNDLKAKLIELNENQTLCDGSIKKTLPTARQVAKFIAKSR